MFYSISFGRHLWCLKPAGPEREPSLGSSFYGEYKLILIFGWIIAFLLSSCFILLESSFYDKDKLNWIFVLIIGLHTIFLYYRCLCGQFRPAPPLILIFGRIIAFLLSTLFFYIIGAGCGQKPQGVLALSVDTLDTSPLQGLVFGSMYKQVCLLQISLLRGLLTSVGPGSSLPHNMCGGKGVTLN